MAAAQGNGRMTDLYQLPGHLIRRLHQISVSIFAARMAEAGFDLTPVQFAALAVLDERPGVDQATLAGLIAHDRVTIGGVVDRLSQKGYLVRRVSKTDRRARELELTDKGRSVLRMTAPVIRDIQEQTLAGLSEAERRTFVEMLRTATEAGNQLSRAPLRTSDSRVA
jgi:MarR family transcriptional regulator, temperature-dependent positive regulator of motility